MENFNLEKFKKGEFFVHCKTEKEARNFITEMSKNNIKFNNRYLRKKQEKCNFGEDTTYGYSERTLFSHGGLELLHMGLLYDYDKEKILEWGDEKHMENNFTKKDLEYGYMVKFRNGNKALYMSSIYGDVFDYCNGINSMGLEYFDDNLLMCDERHRENDVLEVYSYSYSNSTTKLDEDYRNLIWKRKEESKEMTLDEIEKELGYSIKIVNNNKGE